MKNMIFVLFLLIGSAAFAQQTSTNPVGNEPLLKENTILAELAGEVNTAQAAVKASAVSSREQGAAARAQLTTACDNYRSELKKQIAASTNADVTAALNRELSAVNALSPENTPIPSRR